MEWVTEAPIVDHSTLAAFSECPSRAAMVQRGIVTEHGRDLLVGQEVHDAIALATRHYVTFGTNSFDLSGIVRDAVRRTRPDLQPECLDAVRPFVHAWSVFMFETVPRMAILRHDGGEAERCGQLAREVDGVVVTSELDLLLSTDSPQLVRVIDYKTGWTPWDEDSISRSLQFQLHSWLIFDTYPDVEAVDVQVWMTRKNGLTKRVRFERRQDAEISARIETAVERWKRFKDLPLEEIPTHVVADRCRTCPAVLLCDAGSRATGVHASPEDMVDEMVQLQARIDALQEVVGQHVELTGRDVVSPTGNAYGTWKPKTERKPTKSVYVAK
jgi:hypothetical protein